MNRDEILAAVAKGDAIICYAKCHSYMFQMCPGGWHTWADDPDDWKKVVYLLGPDPRLEKCGCPCADGPELPPEPDFTDRIDVDSLDAPPCPTCGAENACAYDAEGRPMIHCIGVDDDD